REPPRVGRKSTGTEHLLLGLAREGSGVAARVLQELGTSLEQLRTAVIRLLTQEAETRGTPRPRFGGVAPSVLTEWHLPHGVDVPAALARVVPIARTAELAGEVRLFLISLEVWDQWFDLRFAIVPLGDPVAGPAMQLYDTWT